jgi:hypothetical protein
VDVNTAALLAQGLLKPLGDRWVHTQEVARQADEASRAVDVGLRPALVAAAWLHDVGYAPELVATGLHALDGARYLRMSWDPLVCRLVAHHSEAAVEAGERGLLDQLDEFPTTSIPLTCLTICLLSSTVGIGAPSARK